MTSMFYQPAIEILKANEGKEMGAGEIAKAILSQYSDLKWSGYQGPVRAMLLKASEMSTPIKRVPDSKPPRFYYHEAASGDLVGTDAVDETVEEIAETARRKLEAALHQEIKDRLYKLTWQQFEDLVVEVISKAVTGVGTVTPRSHDHGVDGIVTLPKDPFELSQILVQAKHHDNPNGKVNEKEVTHFIGALDGRDGIIVTNTSFAKPAERKILTCRTSKVVKINGDKLVELMVRFGVGVKRVGDPIEPMHVDEDFLEELGDIETQ